MRRWYLLRCIDCNASVVGSPETIYCDRRVEVDGGLIEAHKKARDDGYWPTHVIASGWIVETVNT